MPIKFKPYENEMDDGRKKIPLSLHDEIKERYSQLQSLRKTAIEFNCSASNIRLIVCRGKINKRQKSKYSKEKNTLYVAKYRAKKNRMGLKVHYRKQTA